MCKICIHFCYVMRAALCAKKRNNSRIKFVCTRGCAITSTAKINYSFPSDDHPLLFQKFHKSLKQDLRQTVFLILVHRRLCNTNILPNHRLFLKCLIFILKLHAFSISFCPLFIYIYHRQLAKSRDFFALLFQLAFWVIAFSANIKLDFQYRIKHIHTKYGSVALKGKKILHFEV